MVLARTSRPSLAFLRSPSILRSPVLSAALAASALYGVAAPGTALAGPAEWLAGAVVDPSDPNRIVIAYQNRWGGLLVSNDGGQHFDDRCMFSIDTGSGKTKWEGSGSDPFFGVTGDGKLLVPASGGLAEGDFSGCGFTLHVGNPGFMADTLAPDPTDANAYYVYMSPGFDNPDSCARRGLMRRSADGTYTPIGSTDSMHNPSGGSSCIGVPFVRGLSAVRSGNAVRIYELGSRFSAGVSTLPLMIRYTEDDGKNWTEHALDASLSALGVMPRVLLQNPADPQQLIIRFDLASEQDKLFITSDGGATFTPLLAGEVTNVTSSLRSRDGKLWLADRGDTSAAELPAGLWMAPSFGAPFTRVGTAPLYCIAESATGLLGCTIYGFGDLDPSNGKVTERFSIKQTRDYVACAGEDVVGLCADQLCNPSGGEGWCGPLHHASAPICDRYNSTSPCCGWPARDYDLRAEQGLPSDGTCRVVPAYYPDAGATPTPDAGTPTDGGATPADAGAVANDAGAAASDGGTTPSKRRDDGCSVGSPGSRGEGRYGALAALAGALAVLVRRRRR